MGSSDQNTTQFLTYTDTNNIQHSVKISDINMARFKDNVLQFQTATPFRVPVFGKKQEFLRYAEDWFLHTVTKFEELIKFSEVIGFTMADMEIVSSTDENSETE